MRWLRWLAPLLLILFQRNVVDGGGLVRIAGHVQ